MLSHAQARMPSFWQMAKLTSTGNPAALTISGSLESINDFYITGKALLSGPLGYSKTGWTDLFDEPVGTEKRLSAGMNSLTWPVFLINPEARVAAEVGAAERGITIIGETMDRVADAAAKIPGSKILNTMPVYTGTAEQITSQMMSYNRKWILNEMRSGRTIFDIGIDLNRNNRSIFYQMEQNMLRNYQKLHPQSLNIFKP